MPSNAEPARSAQTSFCGVLPTLVVRAVLGALLRIAGEQRSSAAEHAYTILNLPASDVARKALATLAVVKD